MIEKQWTIERPIEDGWYGIRDDIGEGRLHVKGRCVVMPYTDFDSENEIMMFKHVTDKYFEGCEWLGPLTLPE